MKRLPGPFHKENFRMLPQKFTVLVSLLFLFCSPCILSAKDRGLNLSVERLALVIGNGAYQTAALKNPINDAEDMAAALTKLGFNVILKKDADQRTMEDTIRSFGRQLQHGGVGLFYFAGHGVQVQGRNYLIPVDASIESESDVKYEAVDAGRVLGKMEDAQNRLNIVILDACRNNPYTRAFRSDQSGLARMDAPTGSMIAYSTAPGEVAADGTERNGIFTKHLIHHMMTPNLSIEQVLKRVRIDVARQTNGRQIPWESSSLMGDFYFNHQKRADPTEAIKEEQPTPESASANQVASISQDNKRSVEPWTGTWDLKYHLGDGHAFVLIQNGKTVKSAGDSCCEFSGTIEGNDLKGWISLFSDKKKKCALIMSPDRKSFSGSFTAPGWTPRESYLYGKRRR